MRCRDDIQRLGRWVPLLSPILHLQGPAPCSQTLCFFPATGSLHCLSLGATTQFLVHLKQGCSWRWLQSAITLVSITQYSVTEMAPLSLHPIKKPELASLILSGHFPWCFKNLSDEYSGREMESSIFFSIYCGKRLLFLVSWRPTLEVLVLYSYFVVGQLKSMALPKFPTTGIFSGGVRTNANDARVFGRLLELSTHPCNSPRRQQGRHGHCSSALEETNARKIDLSNIIQLLNGRAEKRPEVVWLLIHYRAIVTMKTCSPGHNVTQRLTTTASLSKIRPHRTTAMNRCVKMNTSESPHQITVTCHWTGNHVSRILNYADSISFDPSFAIGWMKL